MFKKRYFSTQSNFKTGFLCKFTLFLGVFLLIVFLFFKISSFIIGENSSGFLEQIYNFAQTTYPESILAISIIFIAISIIFYFFYCQFTKLAKIADDIENEEDLGDFD
jgi:hypothetical protein